MSVVAHGVDLVECARIRNILDEHGERFLERILTPREINYIRTKREQVQHVAGRFAAKEAILKVIGTGWRERISWKDMEILNNTAGQPAVTLTGECAELAAKLGIKRVLISISHTPQAASASAIGLSDAPED